MLVTVALQGAAQPAATARLRAEEMSDRSDACTEACRLIWAIAAADSEPTEVERLALPALRVTTVAESDAAVVDKDATAADRPRVVET